MHCYDHWIDHQTDQGKTPLCPYCRQRVHPLDTCTQCIHNRNEHVIFNIDQPAPLNEGTLDLLHVKVCKDSGIDPSQSPRLNEDHFSFFIMPNLALRWLMDKHPFVPSTAFIHYWKSARDGADAWVRASLGICVDYKYLTNEEALRWYYHFVHIFDEAAEAQHVENPYETSEFQKDLAAAKEGEIITESAIVSTDGTQRMRECERRRRISWDALRQAELAEMTTEELRGELRFLREEHPEFPHAVIPFIQALERRGESPEPPGEVALE